MIVAEGDSSDEKSRRGSAAEDTRIMTDFKAETGKSYDLSFRTTGTLPILDATKPTLRISFPCWASSNLLDMIIPVSFARDIAMLGLLFAISPCSFLLKRFLRG